MAKKDVLDELAEAIGMGQVDSVVADKMIGPKPVTMEDRLKALDGVTAELNKKFDTTHSITKMGSKVGIPIPSISTNLPSVDRYAIQCGGIPRGRIIEVFGPESGGKTTFCLQIIGEEQRATGELCAVIDAEHALDPTWASKCGVDVNNLLISQPDSGEQALETVEALIRSRAVSLIVVDSVSALVPQAELDGDMGDSHMGLQARMMSQAMRKLRGICAQTGVTVIFINQIREKIGVMFGSPETTSGGRALKFYSSVRIDIRKTGLNKEGDKIVGHKMKVKVVKNKVGSPFCETEIDLLYTGGFDVYQDWVTYGEKVGAITKSGSWYNFGDQRLGQGSINAANALRDSEKLFNELKEKIGKNVP